MRGLVDTYDLPLNVSRELLQNNRTVEKIKAALVKRSLDLLEELAADKPAEYAEFWKAFGVVLKEGVIDDAGQKAGSRSSSGFIPPQPQTKRPRPRWPITSRA